MSASDFEKVWTGDEWEKHVQRLLKHHYKPGNYQEVPDIHVGDFGIEGFSTTDGAAYQCYAPEGVLTAELLYERQRNKITADLLKFRQNRSELQRLFGATKINRWILMVPVHSSARLVQHAAAKAAEIRKAGLPYVADTFEVRIATEDDFAVARAAIAAAGVASITLRVLPPAPDELEHWAAQHSALLTTLADKLRKVPSLAEAEQHTAAVNLMVQGYLHGQAVLARLNQDYPEVYERIIDRQAARERILAIESLTSPHEPGQILGAELAHFSKEISTSTPSLTPPMVSELVLGTVADWLMRCPLDFPQRTV